MIPVRIVAPSAFGRQILRAGFRRSTTSEAMDKLPPTMGRAPLGEEVVGAMKANDPVLSIVVGAR
jgi:hypothetical protein